MPEPTPPTPPTAQSASAGAAASASTAALQARLAAIVESSDDGIVSKDLRGVVQSWNRAAEQIFGYTADEMVGQSITRIFPPDRLHEEDEILAKIARGERIEHFKTIRVRKDGRRLPVSVTISPLKDADGQIIGASKIVRDLSRAAELEGRFEAIVASSDDAIVGKDLNGVVESWNTAAEKIFGYTAEEMIGRPITAIIPPDRQDEEPHILDRLKRGERVDHFETVRVRKDGRKIDVSVTISPIKDPTGRVIGASKIARDITDLKRIMREREHMLESEQAARREAERISRAKDEFLATLSHELRTPLNAILGWAQVLRTDPSNPEDLLQGLETIERNARVQTQLIEDLLDMSRIISGKIRLDVQDVDLTSVITSAIGSIRPAADAKAIHIQQVMDPYAGPVAGDPNRLQQVLWNLLTNAVKFTPKGGHVRVVLKRVDSHLEITVSDTGQGIHPDFLPHLFARFSQQDTSTTRRHGGLGIGLAIVRHLVELHGGTIRASSGGPGQGATFSVSLPLSVLTDRPTRQEPAGAESTPADVPRLVVDLSGVRALVVDDEADARALVKRVLESNRALVLTAASADEAIEVMQRESLDVLLSDIGMPEHDGYELLRRVRSLPASQGGAIPAVALTAFARSEDRRRALMAGFQLHVSKPVEPAELLAVVANLSGALQRKS
jgi:PAS domain S-box-containing protein